jgi:hypothetical protein
MLKGKIMIQLYRIIIQNVIYKFQILKNNV